MLVALKVVLEANFRIFVTYLHESYLLKYLFNFYHMFTCKTFMYVVPAKNIFNI